MATYTVEEQVQQLYVGLLGRAADAVGFEYWVNEINSGTLTLEEVRSNFVNEQAEGQAIYDSGNSRADIVAALYDNLFDRAPGAGADYWITGEGASVPADLLVYALINGASAADRAALDASVVAAQAETDADGEVPTPTVPGETILLSEGRDVVTGTDDDDTFYGNVGQNQDGDLANEFATGDVLDGGAGRDMIEATMIRDYTSQNEFEDNALAPRPITSNIEEVYIEALEDVTINTTRMANVEEYWSNFSDADVSFVNVNLNGSNLNVTKDVTFGIRDTRFDTDFSATFDSQSLLRAPEEASNSQLEIRIADVSTQTPATPLANVSVTLGFELGGQSFVLADVVSTDGTYQGLVDAIDAALATQGLSALQVTLSEPYTTVTVAGNTVTLPFTAQEILVTDPDGETFGEVDFTQAAIASVPGGFLVAGNAEPVDPSVTSNLIETNLILDNAGRGSIAGNVTIGGESNSDIGVERFNVSVDRGSKIASLVQSGANSSELEEIYIDSMGANGDLYIGTVDADLNVINATAFEGANLSIGEGGPVSDLVVFNSSGSSTNVTFIADYDGNGRASDAQAFTINTGVGSDVITADVTGTSTSGSTTASVTITSAGGDNIVTLTSDNTEINEAFVTLGSGSDTVTGEETHLTASTGAGSDVIYTENTGDKAIAELFAGGANLGTTGAGTAALVNASQLLYGRSVQVTVAMPEELVTMTDADSFVDGYEVTAEIEASQGYLTTERDLYEAAARAINNDPVVNKLVEASVDSNGTLIVEYLVDGVTAGTETMVQLEVLGDWTDLSSAEQGNVLAGIQEAYSDSSIASVDVGNLYDGTVAEAVVVTTNGTDSATNGVNTVNAGAGDDVIVLSSNDSTVDTVVFDQGGFGNDTIVHYDDVSGGDVLDFSGWLNNVTSASGSTDSQVRVAGSVIDLTAAAGAITDNAVVVTQLEEVDASLNFATMTNAQVLAGLNANFTQAAATPFLVGDAQKSIVMVENWDGGVADDNLGEYKVYEVSYSTTGSAFTSATLVGSVDFGDSLDAASMDATNVA
ncbi:DUF4214 domain-containing protein [Marinobacter sp. ANT_B65]|uniref:DUF4214 domain-containing protein n=1 Tax=Marinobacter sp. ANT_B65 TaxID=2039467 RepID=UPI000BBE55EF|nr:DUF4214 domain-containing protein [Marinobacter sp. ANT_B65]PCM45254.1 hypothetical protein CPA50_04370 [Marinobacter sp. ANT_B65]